MPDDSDKAPRGNFERLAREIADRQQRTEQQGAGPQLELGGRLAREARRRARLPGNPASDRDQITELAARLIATRQEQDKASEEHRQRVDDLARWLDEAKESAQHGGDTAQAARISVERESLEVAKATQDAADAIRNAVMEGLEAANLRDLAANTRQRRMEWITWGLLLFAGLTLAATIVLLIHGWSAPDQG